MRRALLAVAFAAALAATFPTDALVRALTARALPPTWPPVTVGEARLRPSALRLRNVSLRRRDGTALLTLDSLDLHPSLIGLLAGRRGLPLRLVATGCGGSAEGAVTGSPTAAVVTLAVTGVKLADCLPVAMAGSALAGRADARATLQLSAAAPAGDGAVDLRDARWHGTVRTLPGIDALEPARGAGDRE
jgi:type II secretion system protein N